MNLPVEYFLSQLTEIEPFSFKSMPNCIFKVILSLPGIADLVNSFLNHENLLVRYLIVLISVEKPTQ